MPLGSLPADTRDLLGSDGRGLGTPARTLFLDNLDLIERTIRLVAMRNRMTHEDRQDFQSDVMMRLMDHDYEILRRFEGRCRLGTYLTVVVQHMFLDFRNRQWGKWRPSTEAVRMGPVAVRLEALINREGLTFREAAQHLRTNEQIDVSEAELLAILCRLPLRVRRRDVGLEDAPHEAVGDSADRGVLLEEMHATARRVQTALESALQRLAHHDRLILRMRFERGLRVADIARALHLDAKPLYRRFDALLRDLRRSMEEAGIGEAEVRDTLNGQYDIALALGPAPSDSAASVAGRDGTPQ